MKSEWNNRPGIDESSLWKAFKAGDERAFASIYEYHIQGLLNYGRKITPDRQLVQDTIQDLFIELWHSRQRLSDTTSVKFYLFRALRNKLLKTEKAMFVSDDHLDHLSEPSFEFLLMENESHTSRVTRLGEALSKLTKRQQEAISLRYLHDFSNEEVAQMMGLNYQSACKLIYSGLRFLKENVKLFLFMMLFFK